MADHRRFAGLSGHVAHKDLSKEEALAPKSQGRVALVDGEFKCRAQSIPGDLV
jgi:hypothetical protein